MPVLWYVYKEIDSLIPAAAIFFSGCAAAPPGTPPNKEAAGKALRLLLVSPLLSVSYTHLTLPTIHLV